MGHYPGFETTNAIRSATRTRSNDFEWVHVDLTDVQERWFIGSNLIEQGSFAVNRIADGKCRYIRFDRSAKLRGCVSVRFRPS
ncbi:hypothetical protein Halar_0215 (plasmid) [halophilic archaeon DL31]|nr:hypothetical protein Halar_0215 [halophilic archaeon DL31]